MSGSGHKTIKQVQTVPQTVLLNTEQRIEFLANLIIDRIMEDQRNGQRLLNEITKGEACKRD